MPIGRSQSTLTKLEVLSVDFATSGSLNNTDSKLRSGFTTAMSRLLFCVALSTGDVFYYNGLHRICNIYWLDKITNEELFKKTDGMNMSLKIKNHRL